MRRIVRSSGMAADGRVLTSRCHYLRPISTASDSSEFPSYKRSISLSKIEGDCQESRYA